MGKSWGLKCSRCDYEITVPLGFGFLFPQEHAEIMEGIRKGRFGKTVQRFLEEHPDGAVDCERAVCICENCGTIRPAISLDMYISKSRSGALGAAYAAQADLKESHEPYRRYPHRCPKCRRITQALSAEEFEAKLNGGELECPLCKAKLIVSDAMLWD